VSWKPSNSRKIFLGILGSLTPLTLKMSRRGLDKILSATSTLQPPTSANKDDLHLQQKASPWCNSEHHGELEEQPLRPNSNLVSAPLTTTLRESRDEILFKGGRAVTPHFL
jgi:hypothetical protein